MSDKKIKKRLKQLKRQGLLSEVTEDFQHSEEKYNDVFRLGKHYIFCKGSIIRISDIRKIKRICTDYYDKTPEVFIYQVNVYYVSKGMGSELNIYGFDETLSDNAMWKNVTGELPGDD